MKRFLAIAGFMLLATPFAQAQKVTPLAVVTDNPTITITTTSATSTATSTLGIHEALVQFKFGTVAGSFTTCTVQAQTAPDGTNYLTLGAAQSVTVTTGTVNTWTLTEIASGSTSATASSAFGKLTKFAFSCGGYGTSAPATISVTYYPVAPSSAGVLLTGAGVKTATDTSDMAVMGAVAGAINNALIITITNSSATDAFAYLCDGTCATAGTRKLIVPVPAGAGIPIYFPLSHPFSTTAGNALDIAAVAGVTTMSASALGFVK